MIDPKNPDFKNTPANPGRSSFGYKPLDPHARPVVTVVTPFYNTGPIFHETARTVLGQSLQQWEWIIVNDGSTDQQALQILEGYRQLDPRIRVIDHPENRGLPAARNTGIREARAEYCLLIDSDDLIEPTTAEKWFWFLESHPEYAFVSSYSVAFDGQEFLWHGGFQEHEANLERNRIPIIAMVRRTVHRKVGGFEESMRDGLEDWDFWLRSANASYWGASIPEYLAWYRYRKSHTSRWVDLNEKRLEAMQKEFQRRYPGLWEGGFPQIDSAVDLDLEQVCHDLPCENRLQKDRPRLLLVANWMVVGGAEKFNLDLVRQLTQLGWEVTVATTAVSDNPWQHEFERLTPDVFPMNTFLDWSDYPRFLRYLVQSRQVDALLVAASQEAYRLLPYLRFHFPDLPMIDFLHLVTPDWMDGGYPRLSSLFQSCLDLSVVSSQYLKEWMVAEGADVSRVRVSTTNVDTDLWHPDPEKRRDVRARMGISEEQTLILYIARLERQKQSDVFAEAMLRLFRQGLPFSALVIGEGSLKTWLENYLREHQLGSRVRLLGELATPDVRDLMAAGDIIFLPSENEGISLTFYEGMACGLVPVGADVGGQRELVTPECGFLLPRGEMDEEVERYADVLATLIRDFELRRRMGQASRQRVTEYFRLDQMGERMLTLIDEAKRLRQVQPRSPSTQELASAVARASIEYTRTRAEFRKVQARLESQDMPPAPASTYFYFAVRQMLYPIYSWFGGGEDTKLGKLKERIKSILVRKA